MKRAKQGYTKGLWALGDKQEKLKWGGGAEIATEEKAVTRSEEKAATRGTGEQELLK